MTFTPSPILDAVFFAPSKSESLANRWMVLPCSFRYFKPPPMPFPASLESAKISASGCVAEETIRLILPPYSLCMPGWFSFWISSKPELLWSKKDLYPTTILSPVLGHYLILCPRKLINLTPLLTYLFHGGQIIIMASFLFDIGLIMGKVIKQPLQNHHMARISCLGPQFQ